MNKEVGISECAGTLMRTNPAYFGAFVFLVGVFMLLAAFFNWD